MEAPILGMSYHCPLKSSALKESSGDKYCDQCRKHIPDMRNRSTDEIIEEIKISNGEFCGTFHPLQLQNPFGDRRDNIIKWYQKFSKAHQSKKRFLIFISFLVVLVTGCKTRGYPGYSYNGVPILRVHPRSIIQYTEASDFVKHRVYKLHFHKKKEKPMRLEKKKDEKERPNNQNSILKSKIKVKP